MQRQLQIKDGVAQSEWIGAGAMPVAPDDSWTFVDVTKRPDALVGHAYDAKSDTFTPPAAPPDYGRSVSPREFLLLFTASERKTVRVAGANDADIADWYELALGVSEPIRLRHPSTVAGLGFLVAKGLLTPARRDAILGS